MIFDTDILVWAECQNAKALKIIEDSPDKAISIYTYIELAQGARNSKELLSISEFVDKANFQVVPLSENIGHRALVYLEEYALTFGLRASDAIIAATAVENNQVLISGNLKHYKAIKDLRFKHFIV